ncbi:MAG: hypothetical protein Q8S73_33050 [Deltaproteobacteria bacterium]|nr:hypothetical protein [Myxococcales bacterium]MDP3218974.1 hypothetical protein [Deltaproteobacteria bacterium]
MMRPLPVALLAVLLLPSAAAAQTSAEVEATWRLLVAQAQTAQAAGDHLRALDLAQRAVTIHASPSLYRFVAQEQSHLGLLVPALTSAQRCVDAATADRNAPERASTLSTCNNLVRDLQGRVGRLVVDVAGQAPAGLTVTVAGSVLPPALFGVPYLVTPGRVTIDATAPGRVALHRSIDVAAAGTVPVRIDLATASTAEPTPPPTAPARRSPATTPTPSPARPVTGSNPPPRVVLAPRGSMHRTMAWATAIGGAAGLVTGAVLAGVREGAVSSFNTAGCIEDHGVATPTANCQSDQSTANALAPAAIASFVVGGALAAASVVLWVTAPSRGAERAFACAPTLGSPGLACGARF